MKAYSDWMEKLIEALVKLPGIGRRSAERIVFYLLKAKKEEVIRLAGLFQAVKENVAFCRTCHNFSDAPACHICSDPGRDKGLICVVEDPKDVIAIEKTGSYVGVYHVLLGALSALDGIGPTEIQIPDLLQRIKEGKVREIILATNPNTEGETTALYLSKVLKPLHLKVTRIARGIPVGSHIEFIDQATLARSLEGRTSF
ncbi:MAG TPA: recombination mediator RecR [bacterium]|nr:recombination mediator RecR [bacterium]